MILAAATSQIAIDQNMCLNRRIRKSNCQKCQEACPAQSLMVDGSSKQAAAVALRPDSCSHCGLCVAACPAGSIELTHKPLNFELKNGTLELMCSKQKTDSPLNCLGILDSYGLVYLGIKAKKVSIVVDPEQCEPCVPGIIAAVTRQIEKANIVLRKLGRQDIQLVLRCQQAEIKINRRELFAFCFSLAKDTVLEMLPFSLNQEQNYRELLLDSIRQNTSPQARLDLGPLFLGGIVKENCDLCGICVRSCKKNALTITGVRSDGHRELLHNQSKCIGCMACTLLCPINALQISSELSDARVVGSKLPVVLASKPSCSRCGKVVAKTASVCEACSHERTPYLQSIY